MTTPRSLLLAATAVVALVVSTGHAEARSKGHHGNQHRHRHAACAPRAYYGGTAVVRYQPYRVRRPYVTVPVYAPAPYYVAAPYYVPAPYVYDPVVYGPTGFVGFGNRHVRVGIAF